MFVNAIYMMNGSTSKIHSENPPNSLPKGAKSRLQLPVLYEQGRVALMGVDFRSQDFKDKPRPVWSF
jgi:hypothetical protein